ncbi:MAG: ABC transporter ATP-binding protein [Clostridiales Family XIII bacterium]|jgi:oligopeptide/dipeptide ABC transporter ATP-binding protein|nr:ABC transporter ATP-binding protein [Clostridiales Family XIII bacterium]
MSASLFEIRNLSKHFSLGTKRTGGVRRELVLKAVDDLTFDIREGECFGVVGESGSGKSTLGRLILNLLTPTSGEVRYSGFKGDAKSVSASASDSTGYGDISALAPASHEMKLLRRDMQMIFQNPRSSFNPKTPIRAGLRDVARFYGLTGERADMKIEELFALTGLGRDIFGHRGDELSGGQLQRLAIVRALIPSPKFIMADEAVSALDVSVRAQILGLFREMKERLGLTIMFVSHDLTVVEYICDRVIVLYLGAIMEIASARDIFSAPKHPYTRSLLAAKPRGRPGEEKKYERPEGEIPSAVDLPPGCRFYGRCRERIPGVCDTAEPEAHDVSGAPGGHLVACHLYR